MNVPFIIACLWEAITPARRDLLAKQFGTDPETIDFCAASDPTNGKYTPWIVKMALKTRSIILPEDAEKVHETLSLFAKLSRTSTWTAEKDLNKYPNYGAVAMAVRSAGVGKKAQVRHDAEAGKVLINRAGSQYFWLVTTPEAAAANFRDTEWCVKDPKYFKDYGPPFFYMEEREEREGSCLLHLPQNASGTISCMDFWDNPVPIDYFDLMDWSHPIFLSTPWLALHTADILHPDRRWKAAEPVILDAERFGTDASGKAALAYHRKHYRTVWPELQEVLLDRFIWGNKSDDRYGVFHYMMTVQTKQRDWQWPELEAASLEMIGDMDRTWIPFFDYANASGKVWPAGEKAFLTRLAQIPVTDISVPTSDAINEALLYVTECRKSRWPEFEVWLLDRAVGNPLVFSDTLRYIHAAQIREPWPEWEVLVREYVASLPSEDIGFGSELMLGQINEYLTSLNDRSPFWEEILIDHSPRLAQVRAKLAMTYWESQIHGRWPELGAFLLANKDLDPDGNQTMLKRYQQWEHEDQRIARVRTSQGRDPVTNDVNLQRDGHDFFWDTRPKLW